MDKDILRRLESLNQLRLTEEEKETVLEFFNRQEAETEKLYEINTDNVDRMVHVMPLTNVLRDDVVKKEFSRETLQKGAPEAHDGYWQVPRLVE